MELKEFIANFAAEFESVSVDDFSGNTVFRDLEEWSSIMAFSIISMIGDKYDVVVTNAEMKNCKTVEDVFHLVEGKL